MRRRVYSTQLAMARRHFALQATPRARQQRRALATRKLPLEDTMDPDIAGEAITALLFARTWADQNAVEDDGYKLGRKRWYA